MHFKNLCLTLKVGFLDLYVITCIYCPSRIKISKKYSLTGFGDPVTTSKFLYRCLCWRDFKPILVRSFILIFHIFFRLKIGKHCINHINSFYGKSCHMFSCIRYHQNPGKRRFAWFGTICTIYKHVKNTHGGVILLTKLQAEACKASHKSFTIDYGGRVG